jgi:hypothetical protein
MTLPGPGKYLNIDEFGRNAVTFSLRGKSNEKIGNDIPGPGDYNADPNITKDRVIGFKLDSGT